MKRVVILLLLINLAICNNFGPPCLPYRERYKKHFSCMEDSDRLGELDDQIQNMKGAPSRFARTGYYDRLFRQQNLIQWQGNYAYYPTYGYNANLPKDKPFGPFYYRYSNFFSNKN